MLRISRGNKVYKDGLKRGIDFLLSLAGIIVLSPIFLILCLAIKIDSKGPVIFKQKRVGKFLRKTSLDELPQLFNILKGDMAVIGPRPALWNQYDLIEERDKYHANDIRPGLTGLAQISGRDELEIDYKARLDGQYTANITPWMDLKCFFGTIISVFKSEGVVEGGTGSVKKEDAK